MHSTAGAVAIGARPFLVAYNVYLGPAYNLPVAKEVAKAVRGSSGGLRYVKAMGFEVDGQAQLVRPCIRLHGAAALQRHVDRERLIGDVHHAVLGARVEAIHRTEKTVDERCRGMLIDRLR